MSGGHTYGKRLNGITTQDIRLQSPSKVKTKGSMRDVLGGTQLEGSGYIGDEPLRVL